MINEVFIQRLDDIIGDFDTPFFNYLLYSYDLSLNDCEVIVDNLKHDISSNNVSHDNLVSVVEDYFINKVTELEKKSKIEYLTDLIDYNGEFYIKFLKRFALSDNKIDLIYDKVESKILEDNISEFEIKRFLEYYFANSVKQKSYLNDLDRIVGRNYDTLIVQKAKRDYPILLDRDIVDVISDIRGDILDAVEFKKGIKQEFLKRCMHKSENKKSRALSKLENLVEGSGDSFLKLVDVKGLSRSDGERIVFEIKDDISNGLIQPESIDNIFLTKRFNEYNERE